jgi:hypothetical protein
MFCTTDLMDRPNQPSPRTWECRMTFEDFFDQIYVINLPSRVDRLASIKHELRALGVNVDGPKFSVPLAPILDDAGGFPTKGVRGNFLSHLANIEDACANRFKRILVLEDDAIFRSSLYNVDFQRYVLESVETYNWSMWFPGHHIQSHPNGSAKPVYQTTSAFEWAHCYTVHHRGLEALRDYMRLVYERPAGHPEGGKMYIDGALTHFRKQCTDRICLVSNPVLSIQKSSDTNLGARQDSNHQGAAHGLKSLLRAAKDELWRRTGTHINPS